jgi:DNA-directed RNA polymerase alpha subunit
LSTRTNNLLIQAEITEMDELTSLSKSELLNIPGFGEKSYLEVREKLESLNILPSDWE